MRSARASLEGSGASNAATVRELPWQGSNEQLLSLAREGSPAAAKLLYDRFEEPVHRLVWKLLGGDSEHDDVVQDVFVEVFRSVAQVRDAEKLTAWVSSLTVFVVRRELRRRTLRRALFFESNEEDAPDPFAESVPQDRILTKKVYAVLERMPANLRIGFVLRHIEGNTLSEVSQLCDCSRASVVRRLKKAEAYFKRAAARDPALLGRMNQGVSDD